MYNYIHVHVSHLDTWEGTLQMIISDDNFRPIHVHVRCYMYVHVGVEIYRFSIAHHKHMGMKNGWEGG